LTGVNGVVKKYNFGFQKQIYHQRASPLVYMDDSEAYITKEITIVNEFGIHARSAAKIAEIARTARGNVWLVKDDYNVDASSVIDLLTLECGKGTNIKITIEDESDIQVLNGIIDLVKIGFEE
jgi:phosphocarrier protein